MKHTTLTLIIALLLPCMAQAAGWHYVTKTIADESHKLNSAGRPGGQTRLYLPMQLPPWTVTVFYRISTAQNEVMLNPAGATKLATQVMQIMQGKSMNAKEFASGASLITGYQAQGVIDVYDIPDEAQAMNFVNKKDNNWHYITTGSRMNFTGGAVALEYDESALGHMLCLGFRNNSALKAMYFHIEVVAVVKEYS